MRLKIGVIGAATAAALAMVGVTPASAGDGHGDDDAVKVVAAGLDNPRGLVISRGTLYIAEAGQGGDLGCVDSPEGGLSCLGATGKIASLKLSGHGAVEDVLTGLPSLGAEDTGGSARGPSDVAIDGIGQVWLSIGLGGTHSALEALLGATDLVKTLGTTGKVVNGAYVKRGDPAAFEEANDSDGQGADSNPNSLITTGGGSVWVADAGANALVSVKSSGRVTSVATFPNKPAVQIPGAPEGALIEPQAVPDSITRGPDGAVYIGELTGFPFVPETAAVWRIRPGGSTPRPYAGGFTNIIDLAVTPSGDLLVLEIAANGLNDPTSPGALIRVAPDGTQSPVEAGPLVAPGGITVDADGKYAYISNKSVFADEGEIIRVKL